MLNKLQDATLDEYRKKKLSNNTDKYNFDILKMYFGEDYKVKNKTKDIVISMPTIGDILEIGENDFYRSISPFIYNSTSIRVMLWDYFQKDWNKVKDIEVFAIMSRIIENKNPLKLIFKDVSFEDFVLVPAKRNAEDENYNELALYSESQEIILYEDEYMEIAEYIREMVNRHPKIEKAKGKTAVSWIIQEDKMNAEIEKEKNKSGSTLLPLISACINHPGFKYKLHELREVGIYQFMDSVKRLQVYESTCALMNGLYCGFSDLSKIDKNEFNFMRDI